MEDQYFTNPKSATLAATYDATISSSTAVTLNDNTVLIEVTAVDKGIFMKWDDTVSSTNFDEYIGAGLTRRYVVPNGATTANFIQQAATGILVCIEK